MNLIQLALAVTLVAPQDTVQPDVAPVARRVASMALLAAQEYDIGVENGRIVLAPEVEEARLFLTEAVSTAGALPAGERDLIRAQLDTALRLIARTADPADVTARVRGATSDMAARLGISLEEIPVTTPLAARGAEIYAAQCASCHGASGEGNGPAARGLDPAPANLTDAAGLRDASPLDFYRRVTIGVAGTAMPAYEASLSAADRWAVAVHATLLRLPEPEGAVPDSLATFDVTARMSDDAILAALEAPADDLARLAAVRHAGTGGPDAAAAARVFADVRKLIDSSIGLAEQGATADAQARALDAYMAFEQIERAVRTRDAGLAAELEAAFAELRARAGSGDASLTEVEAALGSGLERAERAFAAPPSRPALFIGSLVLLLREGIEAILVVGALLTFLVKTGNADRRRDIHLGVAAALGASALTAVAIETVFRISVAQQEIIEGITMLVAVVVLFYVSYWLLSKMEVVKWTSYVKGRVHQAVTTGSVFALASAAFLAVYREGFETILFYKALFVSGGAGSVPPIMAGMVAGAVLLAVVYVLMSRFGVRLPLRPFFAVTSTFLYVMAFIFAGKGIAELQAGGAVPITYVGWAPRAEQFGVYPTLETMLAQGLLLALAAAALAWIFVVMPRRLQVTSVLVPEADAAVAREQARQADAAPLPTPELTRELIRSLERIDADVSEIRAEIERIRARLVSPNSAGTT